MSTLSFFTPPLLAQMKEQKNDKRTVHPQPPFWKKVIPDLIPKLFANTTICVESVKSNVT